MIKFQSSMGMPFHKREIIYSNPILCFTTPISRLFKEATHFPNMFSDYLLQWNCFNPPLNGLWLLELQFYP